MFRSSGRRLAILAFTAALVGGGQAGGAGSLDPTPREDRGAILGVDFVQFDVFVDERLTEMDSNWGAAHVTFVGSPEILYLNLTTNREWVIRNIPVLSLHGDAAVQTMRYDFDLGVEPGQPVAFITYGIALTPDALGRPPAETFSAPVSDDDVRFDGCRADAPVALGDAGLLLGGQAEPDKKKLEAKKHVNDKDFPNQESGTQECGPVAVSNSLQWLNTTHGLGMKADDTSIAAMKTALGWTEAGVDLGWHKLKDKYMKDKGLPVETKTVPVDKVGEALDEDCDVEMDGKVHIAAIVGITKLDNGKYSIDVRHDTKQNEAGGTVDQTVTYNPKTDTVTGGKWLDGKGIDNFVVECPKKKK